MSNKARDSQAYIDSLYKSSGPLFSSRGLKKEGVTKWRARLKGRLVSLLEISLGRRLSARAKLVERELRREWLQEKWEIVTAENIVIPTYLLIPKNRKSRRPAIIATHGHGNGKTDVLGIYPKGKKHSQRPDFIRNFNTDFARGLVEAGYIVAAPDMLCFGEREGLKYALPNGEKGVDFCRYSVLPLMMLGKSMIGLRVNDLIRVVDFLRGRSEVDEKNIGIVGFSGGAIAACFTMALDKRIRVAVVSNHLNTFKNALMDHVHCTCSYIPGILKYAEMADIAALIAPRPVLYESAKADPSFPIEGARNAYRQIKRIYRLVEADKKVDHFIFEGPHRYNGARTVSWLQKWMPAK